MREAGLGGRARPGASGRGGPAGVTTGRARRAGRAPRSATGATPSFKGTTATRGDLTSVNEEIVHGIQTAAEACGTGTSSRSMRAIVGGWHGTPPSPSAWGDNLRRAHPAAADCEAARWRGLGPGQAEVGRRISYAVETSVAARARRRRRGYTGHGIGSAMHRTAGAQTTAPGTGAGRLRPGHGRWPSSDGDARRTGGRS